MSGRGLHKCPTCYRDLDDHVRQGMGLRNNETLNSLCPGRIRASDIDNLLHNGRCYPERVSLIEYKNGVQLSGAQRYALEALAGEWAEVGGVRRLRTRLFELPLFASNEADLLRPIVEWTFDGRL